MGVASTLLARRRSIPMEFAGRNLAPLSAWVTLALGLIVGISLILHGWRDLWFVIVAPSPQGVGAAVLMSLGLLALALPVVSILGFCTAACVWQQRIGGASSSFLSSWLPWATGLPPVVAGSAIYFACVLLGWRLSLFSGALALIVLNAPAAGARMLRILQMTPQSLQDSAAAAGAGAVFMLFRVALPRVARELFANIAQAAAEMTGQAAALILALGIGAAGDPLSVQIWHFAPNTSLASIVAAQCIVLLALVWLFALIADALSMHRQRVYNT